MTRINVIDPTLLTDKHLLAEHRELTRIPNTIVSGKAKLDGKYGKHYTLNKGHVKVFYDKMGWLNNRYDKLQEECLSRGFNVTYKFPQGVPVQLCGDLPIRSEDIEVNIERILDRFPKNARLNGKEITKDDYINLLGEVYGKF